MGAKWCPQASFIKWAFESLAINEFEGRTFTCENAGFCMRTGEQVSCTGYSIQSRYYLFIKRVVRTGFNGMAFESLAINEFEGRAFTCDNAGFCMRTGEQV
jgi:hypothetical protein